MVRGWGENVGTLYLPFNFSAKLKLFLKTAIKIASVAAILPLPQLPPQWICWLKRLDLLRYSVMSNSLWPHGLQMPGFPVHHQHPEPAQTYVHRVSDAIQPSHPLSSPSPPTFNLSQHQGLFQWVSSLIRWPKLQLQHQSFQWVFRTDFL